MTDIDAPRTHLPSINCFKINLAVIWSLVKEMIGKDLTRMATPVFINEPLCITQKIAEIAAYHAQGAKKAAAEKDPSMRLAQIACHMAGSYTSGIGRMDKPFNPMLGETYEMVTPDFRFLAEAVSHHPAVIAIHIIGDGFEVRANSHANISFNGREVRVSDDSEGGYWHIRNPNKEEPDVYNVTSA